MSVSEPILTSNQIEVIKWVDRHTKFNICDKMYSSLLFNYNSYVVNDEWFESIVQHKKVVKNISHEVKSIN